MSILQLLSDIIQVSSNLKNKSNTETVDYDETTYTEAKDYDIDNTNLNYNGKNICIDFNRYPRRLNADFEKLCRRFPKLKQIESENKLQEIIDGIFVEGFQKRVYIRNLSFENDEKNKELGIRPERILANDFLDDFLPKDFGLLFIGHIHGKKFIVDSICETINTEKALDYEVDCTVIPYKDPAMINANFLYDVLGKSDSLLEHTSRRLKEWEEYLEWKGELAKRQIYGCKYYKFEFDEDRKELIFWLVCRDKEYFHKFKRYLYRDIQAFEENYSKNKWEFEFNDKDNDRWYDNVELGNFKGIVNEYYLLDDAEEKKGIDDIYESFNNPYIVQVAYDLSRDDLDEIDRLDLDESQFIEYVNENVVGKYFDTGFLALSAIGDFALIRRFKYAIEQLKSNEYYSPTLPMWLFDITKAQLPEENNKKTINNWLDCNIASNKQQKKAVEKMINAPDICLIQGPPGTGKTTVIAEAVYQFVKDGNRVLITSQSNDAVDNALERLADSPEIRAIRLGLRKKYNKDKTQKIKFTEDNVLETYYETLSNEINRNWLERWREYDSKQEQFEKDIRDLNYYNKDLSGLKEEIEKLTKEFVYLSDEHGELKNKVADAQKLSENMQNDKIQLSLLKNYFYELEGAEDTYYISLEMQKIFWNKFSEIIDRTYDNGIYMIPNKFNVDASNNQVYISYAIKNIRILKKFKEKLRTSDKSYDNNLGASNVEEKIKQIKSKIIEAVINENEKEQIEYRDILLDLEQKKNKLEYKILVSSDEKELFSKGFLKLIDDGDTEQCCELIDNTINDWEIAIKNAIEENENKLIESGKYLKTIDLDDLNKEIKIFESKISVIKKDISEKKKKAKSKRQKVSIIGDRYNILGKNGEDLLVDIKERQEKFEEKIKEDEDFRKIWEKTLHSFKEKLNDEETLDNDKVHFNKTYINSCNVVGITCTANMRELDDNGFDYFDVVIIDEVSKATPPELLIPLMKAKKAVLVGDHRQLPPMFREHERSYNEMVDDEENLPEEIQDVLTRENFIRFKKMVTSSLFKEYFEQADSSIKHSLLVQYRMHSDIADIINRFYEGKLENGLNKIEEKEKNHDLTIYGTDDSKVIVPEKHAYWIDSSNLPNGSPIYETYINKSTSAYNILEKNIIIEILKKIAEACLKQGYSKENKKTVGIISFYQKQVNEIRREFKRVRREYDFSALDVDINTVDRFQGKEKNIIITSLVRNNRQARASKHVIAFERINVAFSRAQELLIIVGAKHMYEKSMVELPNMDDEGTRTLPVYGNIINELNRKACFITSNKIITPEVEEKVLKEYKKYNKKGKRK